MPTGQTIASAADALRQGRRTSVALVDECLEAIARWQPKTNAFIALDEAKERLDAIGAGRAERIVCYCGGGISATMGLFLLHRLGYDNLALYDASMAEWARDATLPIERG